MEKSDRPWGSYEVILDEPNYKVKRIIVKPGQRLSYQYHHKRQEQWTVIEGEAYVTIEGSSEIYRVGESIHIPIMAKHRVANKGEKDLVFIEVQTGTYFGEDDIVRIEDDYNRS